MKIFSFGSTLLGTKLTLPQVQIAHIENKCYQITSTYYLLRSIVGCKACFPSFGTEGGFPCFASHCFACKAWKATFRCRARVGCKACIAGKFVKLYEPSLKVRHHSTNHPKLGSKCLLSGNSILIWYTYVYSFKCHLTSFASFASFGCMDAWRFSVTVLKTL